MSPFTRDYDPPHRVEHCALVAVVCLSVSLFLCLSVCPSVCLCPVFDLKSRTEGRRKLKIGSREAHETGEP